MSKDYSFSLMPSVSISRSRFARKSQHKTSFNLGYIVPIYCDEVLPGDTRSIDMASLVRMSTPIAPIMDNIYLDFFAFFVPNRLVWSHWKEFMGENNASAGIPVQQYSIPYLTNGDDESPSLVGSLWDYFGLPIEASGTGVSLEALKVSALPFRGYALIYNEWFRNQNIIAPLAVQLGDDNEALVGDSEEQVGLDLPASFPQKAAKLADYFTKALPYAQKGAAVSIPLGTTAPVITGTYHKMGDQLMLGHNGVSGDGSLSGIVNVDETSVYAAGTGSSMSSSNTIDSSNLVVNLQNATAATINQLRYAFQLQKLLEKDALYGSRYFEILKAHFGVISPDARLQRPEYLGGFRQRINIDQVLSTAGYDDQAANQEVGKPGANSVTGSKNSLFTKSFVEHGYIFILAVARHDQTYCQGINRMWSRQSRYDFYFPVFANLGAQDVKLKELYAKGVSADNDVFGYQEAWAEYRYKPSVASGLMRPGVTNSLDFWTLTHNFAAKPTLGSKFIEQDRDDIKRALTTGNNGPDFIADFYFEDIAVRPMPMYSIPGLIDHH